MCKIYKKIFCLAACIQTLQSCSPYQMDRLRNVGSPPPLTQVTSPQEAPNYQPVMWPEDKKGVDTRETSNSLWQAGARSFFRDQNVRRVGDIIRVSINISDKAEIDNETQRSRQGADQMGAPNVAGFENKLIKHLPVGAVAKTLLNITGSNNYDGNGKIKREESIQTEVASIISQILPNGNLVIHGHQEIRINHEVREVSVQGIVRPEDISADNQISQDKIAQARISYGGRGVISDIQQPRIGSQIIDIISPF